MLDAPRMPSRYLTMFFAETDLRPTTYRVMSPSGMPHQIPTGVVLEHIAQTRGRELRQIEDIIRKIDFNNGDLHHFFKHLATAIAASYEDRGGLVTGSTDMMEQLIKIGTANPDLRSDIGVVLRHLEASPGELARVARSLRVLMKDLKSELDRRGGLTNPSAGYYIENLEADAKRMANHDARIARSLRVLASEMKADLGRRGEITAQSAAHYLDNLAADVARIEQLAGM